MTNTQIDPERYWPAWLASLVVHGLLLMTAVLVVGRLPEGAADQASRSVGIVLRSEQSDGQSDADHENPDPAPPTEAASPNPAENATPDAALPTESSAAAAAAFLPKPVGPGPAAAQSPGVGSAAEMTEGGAAGGGRPQGGKARVEVFGVVGEGSRFVYVFDRSVSMNGPPLSAAKRELLQSLESLDTVHQFQIVFFNHRLTAFDLSGGQDRVAFADDASKQEAARFVGGISADGGTDRYSALAQALAYGPDAVFFLTDADDAMTRSEIERIIDRNRRAGAAINTIEFGDGPRRSERNFLTELAARTGGSYGYVDVTTLGR
ncbi:hypothetical protein Pla175_00680 [Pirellulimonas nuda]|uniref:VWFA domain-containing protein n=1 Tax=Pirellulimonas nuda TaxID=2528009 RepID=A0A518D5H1_9BACT|nr:hypothetical protein [Pirellulimonas nuda]QDU86718.1 hypothetical protein Pla175_00680 [Pirellulimonas nuda]